MKNEIIFTPFYSSFLRLCKKKGLSPTAVAKKTGIASGAPTAWKNNGAIPRPEQLKKLCVFFDVSENELLGYSEQKESSPPSGELKEIVDKLVKLDKKSLEKISKFIDVMLEE